MSLLAAIAKLQGMRKLMLTVLDANDAAVSGSPGLLLLHLCTLAEVNTASLCAEGNVQQDGLPQGRELA